MDEEVWMEQAKKTTERNRWSNEEEFPSGHAKGARWAIKEPERIE